MTSVRRIILGMCLLLLTGCGNEFVCTTEIEEENYKTEQKINFEFDKNDKITNATVNYVMIFETEKDAKAYFNVFEVMNKEYEISLDGEKITISSAGNYEEYNGQKDKLKSDLEKNGYTCK